MARRCSEVCDGGAGVGVESRDLEKTTATKQGEGDRDDEVVPGLEIVVVGEEGGVAGGPEEERGDERVAQEARAEEEDDERRRGGRRG